ncbi:MAG: leucine-rich repeat domain-containing protein [Tidjanibacter sp.]|nr:leucine-rich repeat domain-containing protein [Tidjanibacter sp.]
MKKLLLILSAALMFAFVGCESLGDDNVVGGSYSISGAIQKGPFVQGSTITIQPLNSNLKPIGQMYTTQTTNDAGMFEMDDVNSKYAEIIATGYYFDEVEGKISSGMLTLRSIADLKDGTQTNVNLLTSLTYNRIKNLVTNNGRGVSEAQEQAEKELYTALGIPAELQPNVSCGAMNIANNGEGNGLLLAISIVFQDGRTTGELTEYISKFSTDLSDDGKIESSVLDKIRPNITDLYEFEDRINNNLQRRYNELGLECVIPQYIQYLPYFYGLSSYCIIPFTYIETYDTLHNNGSLFKSEVPLETDVELIDYKYADGKGEFCLSSYPKIIYKCEGENISSISLPNSVTTIEVEAFNGSDLSEGITLPEGLLTIKGGAFGTSKIRQITIPQSVTFLGAAAFCDCRNLTDVKLLCNIDGIYKHIFSGCWELRTVILPETITAIKAYAFSCCLSLTNIHIPDSVTSIGEYAFESCDSLTSINIPQNYDDRAIFALQFAFYNCFGINEFTGKYATENGACLVYDNSLILFANIKSMRYNIPEGITRFFSDNPFAYCNDILSITFPESFNEITSLPYLFERVEESVFCKPTTPPTVLEGNLGYDISKDEHFKIYVPLESVKAYKTADGWSEYADYIVGYDFE